MNRFILSTKESHYTKGADCITSMTAA